MQELYGRFLKDVLDQRQEGLSLIKEAVSNLRKMSKERLHLKNINFLTDITNFPVPCLIIKKSALVRRIVIFCLYFDFFGSFLSPTISEELEKFLKNLFF